MEEDKLYEDSKNALVEENKSISSRRFLESTNSVIESEDSLNSESLTIIQTVISSVEETTEPDIISEIKSSQEIIQNSQGIIEDGSLMLITDSQIQIPK
mmetsp:Transcript_32202/g.28532  ORF Transcript_32202/g.28532 Transcript_32202/m.28532 type:complete len:99 (+) Transcript_32202:1160-1456(+)